MNYLCEYCGCIKNELSPYIIMKICKVRGESEIKVCCDCSAKIYANNKYTVKEGNKIEVPNDEKIELYRVSKYMWKPKDIRSKEIRDAEKIAKEHEWIHKGTLDYDKKEYKVVSKQIKGKKNH
jgi:hypothetical protein